MLHIPEKYTQHQLPNRDKASNEEHENVVRVYDYLKGCRLISTLYA